MATEAQSIREELDVAQSALLDCVNELPPGDRDLLHRRYEAGATIKSVAAAVGRSAEGLYKAMRRIHDTLHDCVQRRLKNRGNPCPQVLEPLDGTRPVCRNGPEGAAHESDLSPF